MSMCVITPWWNAHDLVPTYLDVVDSLRDSALVLVVDNGSHPPLEGHFLQDHVKVIRLKGNHGFSRANNVGLMACESWGCDRAVFLNNDVTWLAAGGMHPLAHLDAAIEPGVLVGAQLRADKHADVDGQPAPYLDGWCVGGTIEDLNSLDEGTGVWDEGYLEPSYYGDNDLSMRARAAGMKLVEVSVGLRHMGNHTSRLMDVDEVSRANRERYLVRARRVAATI